MGQLISTDINNRDINICTKIDVHEHVHYNHSEQESANNQIENRPDAFSDQQRENSTQVDEHIQVREVVSDEVSSNEQLEQTSYDSSHELHDTSTQVDVDIGVRESDQVSSNEQIEETSNDSSPELKDKSTQVEVDIAEQESGQVASKEQTDKRSDESSDQVRDNAVHDLIDLREISDIDSSDSVVSTISTTGSRFDQTPSLVPKRNFSDMNIETNVKNKAPTQIEICATKTNRYRTVDEKRLLEMIVGVYRLIETRNGEPYYQHSLPAIDQPGLRFKRLGKYTNKGCWVISPVYLFYKSSVTVRFTVRLRKNFTNMSRLHEPTIKAHEYEFETPWNQHYDCVGFHSINDWSRVIEIGCLLYTSPSPRDRG